MKPSLLVLCCVWAAILVACGPFPFNVDLTLFIPESRLSGELTFPAGPVDVPAGDFVDSGPFSWQVPLHDLRYALDLAQAIPSGPITEATTTVTIATHPDPEDVPLEISGVAEVVLYMAPESADDLWQTGEASSGGEIELGTSAASTVQIPLTEPQLDALSSGRIKLGLELRSGIVTLTASLQAASMTGFTHTISVLRIAGTASP